MLEYTKAAIDKIRTDFTVFVYRFTFASQILYIGYLLYMIFAPLGLLWANIPLPSMRVGKRLPFRSPVGRIAAT